MVEGTISQYLFEIHRLLSSDGIYVLCSLHSPSFLSPLLESKPLGYSVSYHDIYSADRSRNSGCIAICRKHGSYDVDIQALKQVEESCMDMYFKIECPLITEEKKYQIRKMFTMFSLTDSASLPLIDAHRILFVQDDEHRNLGYTFQLFLSDLEGFSLQNEGEMSADEAISFILAMQ